MLDVITDNLDIWTTAQKQKKAVGRGSAKKEEGYGIKKLRELILELAVRGKLVPQDPNDEPASVLLEKIAEEKQRLIDERTIRKKKPLPEVEDKEKPFAIPKSWEWAYLSDVSILENGDRSKNYPNKSVLVDEGIPFINAGHLQQGKINILDMSFIPEERFDLLRSGKVQEGDILYCLRGSLGKTALVHNIGHGAIASSLVIIRFFSELSNDYMMDYFDSPFSFKMMRMYDNGTAQPNLSATDLGKFLIPLPPLAEQHRIVAKVDELMSLCDQLEQEQADHQATHQTLVKTLLNGLIETATHRPTDPSTSSELTAQDEQASTQHPVRPESTEAKPPEAQTTADYFNQLIAQHFDTLFTTEDSIDQLKQTILQLAVMGKLVPQNPKDEPASVLLEKIAQEKAKLIKEGKIKKQKALPEITEDEKPFGLPEGWEWSNLQNLLALVTDGDHQAPPKSNDGIPFLVIGNLNQGVVSFDNCRYVPISYYQKLDWSRQPSNGDILYTVTGSYGIPIPVNVTKNFCVQRHVAILKATEFSPVEYLPLVLTAKYAFEYATEIATGIAQKTVPLTGLRKMPIPVAPIAEQHHIVTKVNQLLSLCDTLKDNLNQAQITQTQLADTIVKQAVN